MTRFWNAQQVAEFLGYSIRKVRDDDANNRIPAPVQFGRLKRWDAQELASWADSGCPARAQWERMKRSTGATRNGSAANA
jgi:predicted DNA-binding transcriptional regulator AlpA